ncbi:MFS transporter [Falsarthrobacter nasiphocae]|uniref:EmrB/QacA subfamily drug resistance transporter n=1 Tax=Falsarthrobacter nasiphocae TaxID=189863 RepID=A0AAE3YG97_9MICC|nr:MFS transporter [Falsarthrobacter nasiphocae]MDR6891388.1 EmrB/QacA subfamily drug resistance transporter [Falsarthrobacter nasiphocae]
MPSSPAGASPVSAQASAPPPIPASTPVQTRTLVVAVLASFIAILDGSVVSLALVAIGRDLGGGLVEQQWVVSGYLLSLGALILVAGSLADRFGRERVMAAGLIGFGATSVICGLAWVPQVLIAARILQGVAGAFLVPSSLAMIIGAFSGRAQGKAIGTWTAWTSVAGIVAPLVGGLLVDALSWRAVFFVNVPPVIVALLVLSRLPAAKPDANARLDVPSAVLAALGLGSLVFGLIELSGAAGPGPLSFGLLAFGVVCIGLFVRRQAVCEHPMMPLGIFKVPNVAAGNLTTVFVYGAMGLGFFALPLYLQAVLGMSTLLTGIVMMPPTLLLLLASSWVGRLSGHHGPRWFMAGGSALAATGYLLMAVLPGLGGRTDFWTQVFPGIIVFGLGLTLIVAPLTSSVLEHLSASRAGIGSAVNNAAARIAGLVTVAFAGLVMGGAVSADGFRRAAWTTAALLLVGALVAAVGVKNLPSSAGDAHDDDGGAR